MTGALLAMPRQADEFVEVFDRSESARHPDAAPRKTRAVDFAAVPPSQWAMHDRLENWARWSRGASGESARIKFASPMFSLYRSSDVQRRRYGGEMSVPIDPSDAMKIHFAILQPDFDPQARRALQWCYLNGRNPSAAAREMGLDELQKLADLVREGRALLIHRGV